MIAIADRYARGDATLAPDHHWAVAWDGRAADLGSADAMLRLADLTAPPPTAARPPTSALPAATHPTTKPADDPSTVAALRESVDWVRRAAATGDPDALLRLGDLYALGLPPVVPASPAAALAAYRRAADGGNTAALARLGYAYEVGWHVPADPAYARACYARGAGDGDAQCMVGLAATYGRPAGVGGDDGSPASLSNEPATQFYWYQRAATAGLPSGMLGPGLVLPERDRHGRQPGRGRPLVLARRQLRQRPGHDRPGPALRPRVRHRPQPDGRPPRGSATPPPTATARACGTWPGPTPPAAASPSTAGGPCPCSSWRSTRSSPRPTTPRRPR